LFFALRFCPKMTRWIAFRSASTTTSTSESRSSGSSTHVLAAAGPIRRIMLKKPVMECCARSTSKSHSQSCLPNNRGALLLLQRVDDVVETKRGGRLVDEVKIDLRLATGLERLPFPAVAETSAGSGFRHVNRFIALLHLGERALKQHIGAVILDFVVR